MGCTYLHNRKGTYYFRMGLSPEFKRRFGQNEFLYSLETKSYPEARRRCLTLARMAHDLLMKVERTPTLNPEEVKSLTRAYFSEGLARLKAHVANVDEAFMSTEAIDANNQTSLDYASSLLQQPVFYLPDSMDGVLERDSTGKATKGAFKVKKVPMSMRPVGMDDILAYVMKQHGLTLSPQSPPYQRLSQGIAEAVDELKHLHQQYGAYALQPQGNNPLFADLLETNTPQTPIPTSSKAFSEVAKAYAEDMKNAIEPLTLNRKKIAYRWFTEKFGDLPIQKINKQEHANAFKALLVKLPSHASKRHKGQKTTALEAVQTSETLSYSSQRIYLGALRSLFAWAIDNGYYEGQNPFTKIAPPSLKKLKRTDDEAGPYSSKALQAIFSSPIYTGHAGQRTKAGKKLTKDSLYWIPLIALFTGARREEICQLHTKDVREEAGIWVIDINLQDSDKHLKNQQSARVVPIHSQLIALGLVDYVKSQKTSKRLFPDLEFSTSKQRYGDSFGRRYARALEQMKIREKGKNFHSFRHTMVDALRAAQVAEGMMMALVGHKDTRQTANYGKGYPIKILREAIDKVAYPFIDWSKVGVVKKS